MEELERPLIAADPGHSPENLMMPEGLSSQHIHRLMQSKLKILKNTIDIIDESIEALKHVSNFALVSDEAKVMVQSYKELEGSEGLFYALGISKKDFKMRSRSRGSSGDENDDSSWDFNPDPPNLIQMESEKARTSDVSDILVGGD